MAARSNMLRKVYSLVLVRDYEKNKILLGYKKRGFGSNKWNGFGGKLDKSETILECAKRY
jgi:8-oxo-dGTP pyrophosphatase MutT (NUDIX family)